MPETKSFRFTATSTKAIERDGKKYGIIEGYASTFGNVDRTGDIIDPSAFDNSLKELRQKKRMIRMLWSHKTAELIGGYDPDLISVDGHGLKVVGEVNLDTRRGNEAYALAKQGVLSDFSIGFFSKKVSFGEEDGKAVRTILDMELLEISLVPEPANQEATCTDVKSVIPFQDLPLADAATEWDEEAATERVRLMKTDRMEKAYLLGEDATFRFPIADVIDGELKAIPKAIFNAAARLQGKGRVSPDQAAAMQENLNRYYQKMGRETPFAQKAVVRLDDYSALTERELEAVLHKGVFLSKDTAKVVAKLLTDSRRDAGDSKDGREAGSEGLTADEKSMLEKISTALSGIQKSLGD